jgi:hypothetical protein
MSRMLSLLVAFIVLLAGFLLIDSIKKASSGSADQTSSSKLKEQADSFPEFQKWREFSSPDGHFRVLLPSLPQHVKDKFADPLTQEPRKYDAFLTTDGGEPVFMISAITFPRNLDDAKDTDTTLKAIIDQILSKNENNHLKSIVPGNFRNFHSIDFSIINADSTLAGKVFAYKNTLYILTMGDKSSAFNSKELEFFINSFQVTEKMKEDQPKNNQK